jgi:hypothetical protein
LAKAGEGLVVLRTGISFSGVILGRVEKKAAAAAERRLRCAKVREAERKFPNNMVQASQLSYDGHKQRKRYLARVCLLFVEVLFLDVGRVLLRHTQNFCKRQQSLLSSPLSPCVLLFR